VQTHTMTICLCVCWPCTRVDAVVVGGATVGWQLSCAAAASVKLTSGLSYILVCQVLSCPESKSTFIKAS
jgi:hypothetical protein